MKDCARNEGVYRTFEMPTGWDSALEVAAEFAEGRENDEFAGAGSDWFMFEMPGVLVRDVDGV